MVLQQRNDPMFGLLQKSFSPSRRFKRIFYTSCGCISRTKSYLKYRNFPVPQWSAKWRGCPNWVDVNSFLVAGRGVFAVHFSNLQYRIPTQGLVCLVRGVQGLIKLRDSATERWNIGTSLWRSKIGRSTERESWRPRCRRS